MRFALVASAVLAAVPARADVHGSLVPELRLGAGYDDNLFLDANPTGALPTQIRSDAIFDVEPRLSARLSAGGHVLALTADYLERITVANRDLRELSLRLDWISAPAGPVDFVVAGVYEHYAADLFPDDTFDLVGGEAGLRLRLGTRVLVDGRYRGDARLYSDPLRSGQVDVEHRAMAWLRIRAHRVLDVELGYTFLHEDSNASEARFERHRADLALTLRPTSWLLVGAGYGLSAQHLPTAMLVGGMQGPRDDLMSQVDVAVSARPERWLEIFVRYDFIYSSSTDAAGQWRRNQVIGGLAFSWPLAKIWSRPPPEAPRVTGHEVTFRFRGAATTVSVVGDWNGWDPSAAPLYRRGDRFEATYSLPPGRHEYAVSVDGVVQPPRDALGYVDDGFGGKNGVVEVLADSIP